MKIKCSCLHTGPCGVAARRRCFCSHFLSRDAIRLFSSQRKHPWSCSCLSRYSRGERHLAQRLNRHLGGSDPVPEHLDRGPALLPVAAPCKCAPCGVQVTDQVAGLYCLACAISLNWVPGSWFWPRLVLTVLEVNCFNLGNEPVDRKPPLYISLSLTLSAYHIIVIIIK